MVATVIRINKGRVISKTHCSTLIALIIAKIPITRKIFAILDPITLPIAISLWPIRAADTVPASSGRLVPMARTLKPITISQSRNCEAIYTAEYIVR